MKHLFPSFGRKSSKSPKSKTPSPSTTNQDQQDQPSALPSQQQEKLSTMPKNNDVARVPHKKKKHDMSVHTLKLNDRLEGMPEEFFKDLASGSVRKQLKDGDELVKEGQPQEYVVILEEGKLVRNKTADDANGSFSLVVDTLEAPHVSGLLHSLNPQLDEPAFATVTSLGPSTISLIHKRDLLKVLSENPHYMLQLVCGLAGIVRDLSKRVRKLDDDEVAFQGIRMLCYDSALWAQEGFTAAAMALNESIGKLDPTQAILVDYTKDALSEHTAANASGYDAVCLFVNDDASAKILQELSRVGVKLVALRCAGFDRVDIPTAEALNLTVTRVPAYSPYAVAEHAVALLMGLNRNLIRSAARVDEANFTLDGLMGFDVHGKKVGVLGTGKIGVCLCNIMLGFGVDLFCYDLYQNEDLKKRGAQYVDTLDEIWNNCDIIFFMMPLLSSTVHTLNQDTLAKLKRGVLIINTSRGGLVQTKALLDGLKSGVIGGAGLDVFEEESQYMFRDNSNMPITNEDVLQLTAMNNVVLTGHQAFFTKEAVGAIIDTTLDNVCKWRAGLTGSSHPNSVYK